MPFHLPGMTPAEALGLFALAAIPATLVALAALIVGGRSIDGSQAAALFPPWWPAATIRSRTTAVGLVAKRGPLPFIVLVRTSREDVPQRLRRSGALFSLDARLLGNPRD